VVVEAAGAAEGDAGATAEESAAGIAAAENSATGAIAAEVLTVGRVAAGARVVEGEVWGLGRGAAVWLGGGATTEKSAAGAATTR
jgi:hypothetical protein